MAELTTNEDLAAFQVVRKLMRRFKLIKPLHQ